MAKITKVLARQVFDSRGTPTVEAEIRLDSDGVGRFITPSGASCGKKEALELRDQNPAFFCGKGVNQALTNIRTEIASAIVGNNIDSQEDLDRILIDLDGTENKSRLGANAVLAVSGAYFHAKANKENLPLYLSHGPTKKSLPLPLVNVINGGAHANNGLDVQEFMIVPSGAVSFSQAMQWVAEVFVALKSLLQSRGISTAVGDEGGFAPKLANNEAALDLLLQAAEKAKRRVGEEIHFALDVAASELFDDTSKMYRLNQTKLSRDQLVDWYEGLCRRYPIISIEDPFHEDDGIGFSSLMKRIGKDVQIVGDDLFVTNERYIREGIEHHYANAVLIKMNQIGTISETISATELTQKAGLRAIISHRSGDSEDCTIADLAVCMSAGQIKTGSMCRSERVAKYNRLLRIEEELGTAAIFEPWSRRA